MWIASFLDSAVEPLAKPSFASDVTMCGTNRSRLG